MAHTCSPCDTARAHRPVGAAHASRPAHEAARGRGVPRALAILEKRPQTLPNLQLNTNTIFSSLRPSHLTPWPFSNSATRTPGGSVHGGVEGDDTAQLCRPPKSRAGPSVGLTFNYGPTAYTKQQRRAIGLAEASCSDVRPSAAMAQLPW